VNKVDAESQLNSQAILWANLLEEYKVHGIEDDERQVSHSFHGKDLVFIPKATSHGLVPLFGPEVEMRTGRRDKKLGLTVEVRTSCVKTESFGETPSFQWIELASIGYKSADFKSKYWLFLLPSEMSDDEFHQSQERRQLTPNAPLHKGRRNWLKG